MNTPRYANGNLRRKHRRRFKAAGHKQVIISASQVDQLRKQVEQMLCRLSIH